MITIQQKSNVFQIPIFLLFSILSFKPFYCVNISCISSSSVLCIPKFSKVPGSTALRFSNSENIFLISDLIEVEIESFSLLFLDLFWIKLWNRY